jgi:hypothetical protein
VAGALIVLALAGACSRAPSLPGPGGGDAVPGSAASGPCELLEAHDVDVALNAPISGDAAPGRARPLLVGMEMCSLWSAASGANWGVVTESAGRRFRQYGRANGPNVEPVRIHGHDALWDGALRTLLVLDEPRAFGIQLSIEKPPVPKDRLAAHLKSSAQQLAEIALERMPRAEK